MLVPTTAAPPSHGAKTKATAAGISNIRNTITLTTSTSTKQRRREKTRTATALVRSSETSWGSGELQGGGEIPVNWNRGDARERDDWLGFWVSRVGVSILGVLGFEIFGTHETVDESWKWFWFLFSKYNRQQEGMGARLWFPNRVNTNPQIAN